MKKNNTIDTFQRIHDCNCRCHTPNCNIMHSVNCCAISNATYKDKDGNIDLELYKKALKNYRAKRAGYSL